MTPRRPIYQELGTLWAAMRLVKKTNKTSGNSSDSFPEQFLPSVFSHFQKCKVRTVLCKTRKATLKYPRKKKQKWREKQMEEEMPTDKN